MSDDDSFEKRLKAIADQLARSLSDTDVDEVAERFGIDPERVRGVTGAVERWLSDRGSDAGPLFGDRPARAPGDRDGGTTSDRPAGRAQDPRGDAGHAPSPAQPPAEPAGSTAPAPSAYGGPHPLDLPTDAQGVALSALDSGRWTVRPGSTRLVATGEAGAGTFPDDTAADLVNELRARDWITADGAVTLVGRQALVRWTRAADGDAAD
jgi:hypothetical protein